MPTGMNAGPARRARRPYAATTTTGATAFEAAANTTSRSDDDDDDAHEHAHTRSLSRALHAAATRDEERIAELLATHACQHVYIDVGSNIGVQLRKLFEPTKYPKAASTHGVYERYFGPVGDARCAVCAIGIEPNPHHRPKLTNLQRRYRVAGVRPRATSTAWLSSRLVMPIGRTGGRIWARRRARHGLGYGAWGMPSRSRCPCVRSISAG